MTVDRTPGQRGPVVSRRTALRLGTAGAALLLVGGGVGAAHADPVDTWRRYPSELYSFRFPEVEGLTENQTDTWYTAGKLVGQETGREFAFITIFCKNRPAGPLARADFYTFALFDLDSGEYGTYTLLDFPPANLLSAARLRFGAGHLDLAADTPTGPATWTTRRTAGGALDPFRYHLDLVGVDQDDRPMRLDVDLDPRNAPSVPGGAATRGIITCFGQEGTGSYFQTGPTFSGDLTWGDVRERVVGTQGHIDRQLFPSYAGVQAGLLARDRSHEWRSVNLDDGTDLAIWRQFHRTDRNSVQPFTGTTRYLPEDDRTVFAADLAVTYHSYVKWPESVSTFVPPPSPNRYLPDAHSIRAPELDLELSCTPLVRAPAHGLPVEYMIGPVRWDGTFGGQPVSGFGFSERTLALYRIWELADVVRVTVAGLPATAYGPGSVTRQELAALAEPVAAAAEGSQPLRTAHLSRTTLRPAVDTLTADARTALTQLLRDLETAPLL